MAKNGFFPGDFSLAENISPYLKLEEGTHKIVFMPASEIEDGNALDGFVWWTEDDDGRHPNRVKEKKEVAKDATEVKQFLTFKVWNQGIFEDSGDIAFQMLDITQKTILKALTGLVADSDWGDPVETYPVSIERKGQGLETTYTVTPKPKKQIPKEVKEAFGDWTCDMKKLYSGDDPFETETLPF